MHVHQRLQYLRVHAVVLGAQEPHALNALGVLGIGRLKFAQRLIDHAGEVGEKEGARDYAVRAAARKYVAHILGIDIVAAENQRRVRRAPAQLGHRAGQLVVAFKAAKQYRIRGAPVQSRVCRRERVHRL